MPQVLDIYTFINNSLKGITVIDVRTPNEFEQGHIPGAYNIPLFSNDERAIVGTIYKQIGKQQAIIKGLEIVGPNLSKIVTDIEALATKSTIYVHCWRGGMRSGFVAMLLQMYGISVFTLKGGYKAYRNFVLKSFNKPVNVLILGGNTGSGKTLILKKLKQNKQQVIDLEGLAQHKGSAFGALGELHQPSQEQFENELAMLLITINVDLPVWLEDESRLIGKKVIPLGLWEQMLNAKVVYLNLSFEERLNYIVKEYGVFSKKDLETCILKISKRLGLEQTANAITALHSNDVKKALEYCLFYYDKTYKHGLIKRDKTTIKELFFENLNVDLIAEELIKHTTT